MNEEVVVVEPYLEAGAAARQLGVSPSGLRRLADSYEGVHGELPRKDGTKARLYPAEALERLAQARVLVEAGTYKSTVEALTALARGLEPDPQVEIAGTPDRGLRSFQGRRSGCSWRSCGAYGPRSNGYGLSLRIRNSLSCPQIALNRQESTGRQFGRLYGLSGSCGAYADVIDTDIRLNSFSSTRLSKASLTASAEFPCVMKL